MSLFVINFTNFTTYLRTVLSNFSKIFSTFYSALRAFFQFERFTDIYKTIAICSPQAGGHNFSNITNERRWIFDIKW